MTRLRRIHPLHLLALIAAAGLLAACGDAPTESVSPPGPTVPNVGVLPGGGAAAAPAAPAALPAGDAPDTTAPASSAPETSSPESTSPPESSAPETTDGEADGAFGSGIDPARRRWLAFAEDADPDTFAGGAELHDLVDGRRVLMIGDSIMASTSPRYGGEMCETLVPRGWDVEIDAETGRFVDFGDRVLDQRLDDGFDAAVVMLGNNYGADKQVYEEYLRDIVDRLAPRPTVLVTVTEFRTDRKDVNDTIYDVATDHDNVRIADWAGETAEDPALVGGDGLHLSDLGRERYAELIAGELGRAPGFGEGDCLGSDFTDDSAGTTGTGTSSGQVTMPPSTWPQNNNNNGGGGGGGGGSGGGGTLAPTTTQPAPPPVDTTPQDTSGPTVPPTVSAPEVTQPQPTPPPPTQATTPPPPPDPPTQTTAPAGGGGTTAPGS